MTDFEPQDESEDLFEIRKAAVEALQKAARQSNPREFDRLTRYALWLIDRARAIRRGRQRAVPGTDETLDFPKKDETATKEKSRMPRSLRAKFTGTRWRPSSRKPH